MDAELRDVLGAISNDGPSTTEHVDELCSRFIESFRASESEQTDHFNREERGFRERCYKQWRSGLDLLQVFRHFCAEVGSLFQKEFCRYGQYRHDPLLGVLMRQHANACRIAGEVEALLRCGYPDGALARWRTLHEIAVSSILIRKFGMAAAEDFVRYGLVEAAKGMEAYQETADAMGRVPYVSHEIDAARKVRDRLVSGQQGLGKPFRLGASPCRRCQVRETAGSCRIGQMEERLQVGKPERSHHLPGTTSAVGHE